MLTQSILKEVLHYDPNTGEFRWKINRRRIKYGNIAGTIRHDYITIVYEQKQYFVHRLAWLYMTGNWPTNQIDHINGIGHDNRWHNLREATNSQNNQNRALSKNNKSGFIGVSWCKQRNKWRAQIKFNNKKMYLGSFECPQEAYQAYLTAKAKYHTFNPIPR